MPKYEYDLIEETVLSVVIEADSREEADEKADVHAGVVPEERTFAALVFGGEALGEHHVDTRDVQARAG